MALAAEGRWNGERATKILKPRHAPRMTIQSLLSQYIQFIHPLISNSSPTDDISVREQDLNSALLEVFREGGLELLQAKGWGISDLMSWAWILSARSSEQAATRLMMLASPPSKTTISVVPTFVFLLLLRRQDVNLRSLRLLIIHAWHRLQGQSNPCWADAKQQDMPMSGRWSQRRWTTSAVSSSPYKELSEPTIMVIAVRLLRHCRKVWPVACVSVATMLTQYLNGTNSRNSSIPSNSFDEKTSARLTFLYNRILSLLSLPSSQNPLQATPHHQRAQFTILRRMNTFEPALAINREGYRAVTRVQLAHKKTLSEREWAGMKAKSWPPWKEEKLGLDVDIGPEDGISRASESLIRSKEAGYATESWESAAGILAGWDTDKSPTIQTRIIFQQPVPLRKVVHSSISPKLDQESYVWTARIRATRTLDEGWVCFLAYKNQEGNSAQGPYYAMYEKLVFENKRRRSNASRETLKFANVDNGRTAEISAGDRKEIFPTPESPRDAVYVRTRPPTLDEFFSTMTEDQIHPSGRFLAFLLAHAESLRAGVRYLKASSLPLPIVKALLEPDLIADPKTRTELDAVPEYVFAAFIRFLSRFAPSYSYKNPKLAGKQGTSLSTVGSSYVALTDARTRSTSPLLHAFQLMVARKPYYSPPWNSLFSALARVGTIVDSEVWSEHHDIQDTLSWNVMCDLHYQMQEIGLDIDLPGFQILCVGLEKAIFASEELIRESKKATISPAGQDPNNRSPSTKKIHRDTYLRLAAEKVLSHGLPHLKKIFKSIVTSSIIPTSNPAPNDNETNLLHSQWVEIHNALPPSALLPRLLEVPFPSQLHAFIRVLGLRRDYLGILELVEWMLKFAPELQAVSSESANGRGMMRRCLVAVRVFLERSWIFYGSRKGSETDHGNGGFGVDGVGMGDGEMEREVPDDVMTGVYEAVTGNEEWGGWPTDEEVEAYCSKGRFLYH